MAIRAADIAFFDLRKDPRPRLLHGEKDDVPGLRRGIAVIEVENHDVHLAAVDAWVAAQVLPNMAPILLAIATDSRDFPPDVGRTVAEVVRASIGGVAWPAAALTSRARDVVKGEFPQRLDEPAVIAAAGC